MTKTNSPAALPGSFEPSTWDDIVGNYKFKKLCQNIVYQVRVKESREAIKMLSTGESRGGKTSLIEFTIKTLLCCNLDLSNPVACGRCTNCNSRFYKTGTGDWSSFVDFCDSSNNKTPVRFHFHLVDCARVGTHEIEDLLDELRSDADELRIVYLDEVHRLAKQSLDERFLKPLDSYKVIWFASSAMVKQSANEAPQKLDKMFQNRFPLRVETEKPSELELAGWLAHRCKQFGLTCDNPEVSLVRLARRANRIPGMALQVIDRAHFEPSRELTMDLIESYPFDFDK